MEVPFPVFDFEYHFIWYMAPILADTYYQDLISPLLGDPVPTYPHNK